MKYSLWILVVLLFICKGNSPADSGDKHPPCVENEIPHYTAFRTATKPHIDGCLDEHVWQVVPQSPRFRDLVSGSETIHDTRAALLWDEEYLYVAYWIEEPDLQATLTERDDLIYQNNDVELFIAGDDAYYEFEINSFGTIYEVFFIWDEAYKNGCYDTIEGLKPGQPGSEAFHGVGYKSHPRGPRTGFFRWDFPGLQSAVQLDGTINDDRDRDRGWTVELALPWSGMSVLALGDQRNLPPEDQDVWRMDFSRFNQYKEAPPSDDHGGWAWSPHGVWDSHVPECFTYIHFSLADVISKNN
ncbi:MAG: carbohydrate-binding family 9-like protein [Bacteroidota bacterium]